MSGWGLGGLPVWAYDVFQDAPTVLHPNRLLRGCNLAEAPVMWAKTSGGWGDA